MRDNLEVLSARLPSLMDGVIITVQLTLGGGALAFLIAVTLGVIARSEHLVLRGGARVVIEFFRGTSLLVQLFWLFYVLPLLGWRLDALFAGVLALGLNYGAYSAEVVRGAINSVPKGQWEATTALSMRPMHRLRRVIWPQAWAIMIPSLTNLFIMLLKGTAVASVLLMQDLTWQGAQLRRATGDTFFAYGVTAVIYFAIAGVIVLGATWLERHAKRRLGQGKARKVEPVVDMVGSQMAGAGGRG